MANTEQIDILKSGSVKWNDYRAENLEIKIDFRGIDLSGYDLRTVDLSNIILSNANLENVNFSGADLGTTDLKNANMKGVNLSGTYLNGSRLNGANLKNANLQSISLRQANLSSCNLKNADLSSADLTEANFTKANLKNVNLINSIINSANFENALLENANLENANLNNSNLSFANLSQANMRNTNLRGTNLESAILYDTNLEGAQLIDTNLSNARLENCQIFGISAWRLKLENTLQRNLLITSKEERAITVDDIEIGPFVYLMLNSNKIRNVISEFSNKAVLIIGHFFGERNILLEVIKTNLQENNYIPIVFSFYEPLQGGYSETLKTLAGLSKFIIIDLTSPKSTPLELNDVLPYFNIPIVPIIQEGHKPFAMFRDLSFKYKSILPTLIYDTPDSLVSVFNDAIILPALQLEEKLIMDRSIKTKQLRSSLNENQY